MYGVRRAAPEPVVAPGCLPLPFVPLPDPRGPERSSAASLSRARPRARVLRVEGRVAGPRPPERGVEVGERRLSLILFWMLL